MKPEELVVQRLTNHIKMTYPDVIFRLDLAADVKLPIQIAKKFSELHGKYSKGYPDLFIARMRKGYGGLYLEVKATDKVPNNNHTIRQAYIHSILRKEGYKVAFCCGYEKCKKMLKEYLN